MRWFHPQARNPLESPGAAGLQGAARRRLRRQRLRRVLPRVVVGSSTLLATGALLSWVEGQPGITVTPASSTSPSAAGPTGQPSARSTLSDVTRALDAEVAQVSALQARLHALDARRQAAATAAAATSASSQPAGGGAVGSGAVGGGPSAPLPPIALPAIPKLPTLPAVHATTGASRVP